MARLAPKNSVNRLAMVSSFSNRTSTTVSLVALRSGGLSGPAVLASRCTPNSERTYTATNPSTTAAAMTGRRRRRAGGASGGAAGGCSEGTEGGGAGGA